MVEDCLATTWQSDFLRPSAMQRIVDTHMSGKADFADKIWAFSHTLNATSKSSRQYTDHARRVVRYAG